MSEESPPEQQSGRRRGTQTDEIRTVGFRLREIQRLLALRVQQENRRLEAEGIEPVEEPKFRNPEGRSGEDKGEE